MKKLLLSLCVILMAVFSAQALVYTVTVPDGTKACYVVGDFNSWSDFVEMTKISDTEYSIDIPAATETQGYKYCSGPDWGYVEKQADGTSEVPNRVYSANDVVVNWAAIYEPPAPAEDRFSFNWGIAGRPAEEWQSIEFTDSGDGIMYTVNWTLPDDNENLSFYVGYNGGSGDPVYRDKSETKLVSQIRDFANVVPGEVILTIYGDSNSSNWWIGVSQTPASIDTEVNKSCFVYSNTNNSIKASFDGTASVEVYTTTGKLIAKRSATNETVFSNLVNGLYLVKINNQVTKVLVK